VIEREDLQNLPKSLIEPWPELPSHYESVFHYTESAALESIAKNGIQHFSERDSQLSVSQRHLLAFDTYCDKISEKLGLSLRRSKATFLALPSEIDRSNWSRFGGVKLEIKVDPEVAQVLDRQLHSFGVIAYYRTPEGRQWLEEEYPSGSEEREEVEKILDTAVTESWDDYIEKYLKNAVSLAEYLQLSEADQLKIEKPEVIFPSSVDPQFIRIAH
jgi:hypothetical protein